MASVKKTRKLLCFELFVCLAGFLKTLPLLLRPTVFISAKNNLQSSRKKTKSAAIAFFLFSSCFLLALSFSPFLFLR